ncbi:hypothetical protein [Allokutzneria sp. NRRL B-24872]|uniref:hypothetical protein n=1 Tax=Allokutzneria sp. NRRL B-24872 TaxID=1137961 RepID=UPI000A3AB8F2|nr:hypothetical protein [Allokutzneria sp. NRRL B-24872]
MTSTLRTATALATVATTAAFLGVLAPGAADAAACKLSAGAPFHNSGNIKANVSTSGCSTAVSFTAKLQWKNMSGVAWTNLDSGTWRGSASQTLLFDCKAGERETYRVVIDGTDGSYKPSGTATHTCGE